MVFQQKEVKMAFLIVKFSEARRVIIDDVDTGIDTDQIIEAETGHHSVTLGPPPDFKPPVQEIVLEDNTALDPKEVYFEKI